VDLNRRDGLLTIVWTLGHRMGDVACLGFSCYAVDGHPRWAGLMIAFAAGKAVGTVPFLPAGLGYVDATLVLTLTSAAGLPAAGAIVAAFVYRLISLILVAVIGWIVFAFLFRRHQAEHAEIDRQIDAELKR
jgi:putative heme transporter